MGAKFFVYAGRRWRELDTEDGSLEGWGRARFVYLRRGRLNLARRGAVLRALRALGTGCGVAARDGLPLSKYEPPLEASEKKQESAHACYMCQSRCGLISHHCAQCAKDAKFDRLLRPETSEAGVQCVVMANAGVQATLAAHSQRSGSQLRGSREEAAAVTSVARRQKGRSRQRAGKGRRSPSSNDALSSSSGGRGDDLLKELIIDQSDVALIRGFLARGGGGGWLGLDLDQFDADEAYRERVFYRINPLVVVERCPRVGRMLSDGRGRERGRTDDLSIRQFMTVLGLRTVGEGEDEAPRRYKTRATVPAPALPPPPPPPPPPLSPQHDKENEARRRVRRSTLKRPAKVLREDNDGGAARSSKRARASSAESAASAPNGAVLSSSDEFLAPRPPDRTSRSGVKVVSGRSGGKGGSVGNNSKDSGSGGGGKGGSGKSGSGREYTAEEDAAIVAWVAKGGRARCVNGNRLWRELQRHHAEATGTVRSWHSLRNRYLRYILPALPRFANPRDAARLRADAATGELKSRKQEPKENSMLVLPRVRSAWSRRRPTPTRSPTHSPTPSPTSPSKPPRRHTSTPTEKWVPRRTPRFSELARRFADRPDGDSPTLRRSPRVGGAPPPPSPPEPEPAPERPHRRRLYNPHAGL